VSRIERIHAREVFDSRGKPTVEVEVCCEAARPGRAIVPSGASTGRFEAVELRDGDKTRLEGTGVLKAVSNVNGVIASALNGQDASDQQSIDRTLCELDGTENKARLGANAILGTSLACAYATAEARGVSPVEQFRHIWKQLPPGPGSSDKCSNTSELGTRLLLPLPMVNMISGGLHAGRNLDFQDFLILPVGANSYRQAFDWVVAIYRKLGTLLSKSGYEGFLIGDEGGYGPRLINNSEAVKFVIAAIEASGFQPGDDVAIGLDVASTHFFKDGNYLMTAGGNKTVSPEEMVDLLEEWVDRYPIISIEDGLAEDDWDGWKKLTERLSNRVQLIGDDLFVTNCSRLQQGIVQGVSNSVLVKLNQVGTLWETLETLRLALDNGYWPVISARSGETEDTTIADLVVATGAGQLKVGSVARSERLAKYNQLLRLEDRLGDEAGYLGGKIFADLKR
jgi:enolase